MSQIEQPPLDGELVHHPDFPSQYVRPRLSGKDAGLL